MGGSHLVEITNRITGEVGVPLGKLCYGGGGGFHSVEIVIVLQGRCGVTLVRKSLSRLAGGW